MVILLLREDKMEQSIRGQFDSLCSRLSPENLACDGEISKSQITVRLRQIRKESLTVSKIIKDKMDSYSDKNDAQVGKIFKALFPDKEIIPVNCLKLIEQGGSLHCSTMQIAY